MGEAGVAMTVEEEVVAIMEEVVEVGEVEDITEEVEEEVVAVDITPLVTKAAAARETRLSSE